MQRADVKIRAAEERDVADITAIYRASVEATAASFEIEAPGADEMRRRMLKVREAGCPWLVAEDAVGRVAGYAYARPFHERAAFAWTVEDAIYIGPGNERQGLGRALLSALIDAAEAAGFRQMIAVISSDAEAASVPLHLAAGFELAGRLAAVGFKNGRWHDIVYMRRPLGAGSASPPLPAQPAE